VGRKYCRAVGPSHWTIARRTVVPSHRTKSSLRRSVWGLVLGWIGFTGLPLLFHASLSPDPTLFGPAVFVFIFVMWINIHHYFIDNVIWRRDNEDVQKYLFAPR
jgi:hypothetical protein